MESLAPPGSRAKIEHVEDEVSLGATERVTAAAPTGPRGWRKAAAIVGLSFMALGGAINMVGPGLGPALSVAQQTPQDQVVSMLGSSPITAAEKATLLTSLKPIDPEVVNLLAKNGLRVAVAHSGQDLMASGFLREQTAAGYEARQAEIRGFMTGFHQQVEQRFDGRMRQLESEQARYFERVGPAPLAGMGGFFPMGGFGAPQQLTPDQQKLRDINLALGDLSMDKNEFVATRAMESGLGVKPFSFPVDEPPEIMGGGLFGMGGAAAHAMMLQSQMPVSLLGMAQAHGAKSPEQIREFIALVELINGERLQTAQKAGAEGVVAIARASHQPTEGVASAALKYPERIPLDHRRFSLLVPDMFYTEVGGRTVGLDDHDRNAVAAWTDPATGLINSGRAPDGEPEGRMGQYFHLGGANAVLIRDFRVGATTPVHEFGHALDFLVEKLAPEWHQDWSDRVAQGFKKVGSSPDGPQAITDYSRTNVLEYVGDGFLLYHTEPETLKTKDPELHKRIAELIEKARELNGPQAPQTLGSILEQLSKRSA